MKNKKAEEQEKKRLDSAIKHSEESRSSTRGYLEIGNDAQVHAKARAMRNNDNGSHM